MMNLFDAGMIRTISDRNPRTVKLVENVKNDVEVNTNNGGINQSKNNEPNELLRSNYLIYSKKLEIIINQEVYILLFIILPRKFSLFHFIVENNNNDDNNTAAGPLPL